jgi:hypothetical protein
LSHRWIEQPIRTSRHLARRPDWSLCAAAGAALLTIGTSAALASFGQREMTLDAKYKVVQAATVDYGFAVRQCYTEGRSAKAVEAKVCEFGDPRAARTLVLFGDSHAMQWINTMRKAADEEGWHLVTLVKPGCAASDINPHDLDGPSDSCKLWRAQAIEKIVDLAPFAVVMASYNGATVRGDMLTPNLMPVDEVRTGTRSTLLQLRAAGLRVVVLRDSPLPPFNVPACISRSIGRAHSTVDPCEFDASKALNASAFEAERAAGAGLTNVDYLDMDDLICSGASCPAVQDGRIVYRDENHLAGSYAESLADELAARLSRILDRAPALAHRSGD